MDDDALFLEIKRLRTRKDEAFAERNRVVAALARLALSLGWRAGLRDTNIDGWDPEWHGCVYIDTPEGQISWHYNDRHAEFFDDLPPYTGEWDGHNTPEKYRRLNRLWRNDNV